MSLSRKKDQNKDLTGLIIRDFNLDAGQFGEHHLEVSEIKNRLKEILEYLLNKDFERLLNAMYRLDIDENKFREVINGEMGNDICDILADMIIEREFQKVLTRMKYRENRAR